MEVEVRVEAVIFRKNSKLLLAMHKKNDTTYWVLPGGHIEFGEKLEDALKRELNEELGLNEFSIEDLVFVDEFTLPKRHVVKAAFRVSIPEDEFDNLKVVAVYEAIADVKDYSKEEILNSQETFYPSKDFLVNLVDSFGSGNR